MVNMLPWDTARTFGVIGNNTKAASQKGGCFVILYLHFQQKGAMLGG